VYEARYDLTNDPHEEKNLATRNEHQAILESLRKGCDELRDRAKGHQ